MAVTLLLILILLVFAGSFIFVIRSPINNLLTLASNSGFGNQTNTLVLWYLKHSKKINEFSLDFESPLHLIFRGCTTKEEPCKNTAQWLLQVGVNVDQISSKSGMTVLHHAILRCEPDTVQFLMQNEASPLIRTVNNDNSEYDDKTAYQLFKMVEHCPSAKDLYQALRNKP